MSTIAGEALLRAGYADVAHLDGGMVAWESAGRPLVDRAPAT
jgi:rhodanese-related sulfurtransferase